ncbi:MAG: MurR/RpiR family transcriptional regulator [Hungatella hathewayi]
MNQTTSLLTLLCSDYDKFFEAEKKIADYIIANKKAALDMTIAELAKASDTSDATVSRFCKKLGLKNYQTFRLALAKDVMEEQQQSLSTSNDISLDNVNQSLQNILANKVAELTSTVSMIEADNLTAIIRCLESADIIQVAAVGNTIPVAADAAFKFNQLGLRAPSAPRYWKTERLCSYPDAGDVSLVISTSGTSKRLTQLVRAARDNHATVVLITNDRESPLAKLSNYLLITATRRNCSPGILHSPGCPPRP